MEEIDDTQERILLIDDDRLALLGMGKLLSAAGFAVDNAVGGQAGIERVATGKYDLIITDLVMDDADGIEVLKAAKENDSESMVIVLTGYGEFRNALDAFTYQADDFILKPCGKDELTFRINRCLEKLKLKRELRRSLEENSLLVKEIHHRMKNNLAMVSSLVALQTAAACDEYHRGLFEQLRQRITSLTILHEQLHRSNDPRQVPLKPYLMDLLHNITNSLTLPGAQVLLDVHIAPVTLPVRKTVPVGLIITELLTNTYKYAADPDGVTVRLRVEDSPDGILLEYSDDGPGFPKDFRVENVHSLGLCLVDSLVRQIDGRLSFLPESSTFSILLQDP